MELRPKSALSRLVNGLKREQRDCRVSLDVFPVLNPDKLERDRELAKTGAERGAREEPAADTLALEDIESAISERVEVEKNAAHGTLLDEVRTYKERLTGLDFEGRFGTIRQAAPAAVGEFRAEAAQGRDELHNLRRHLGDLELERDEFRRRHDLKRAAHWASGGNLTVKIGVLLVLFGFVALIGYLALMLAINLALAHYREVSAELITDAGREVLTRLQTMPLGLTDFKSWLLFGLGVLCSLIAFTDSFLIFDPYPGYA